MGKASVIDKDFVRPMYPEQLIAQMGYDLFAVSGGRYEVIRNAQGEAMSIEFPCGQGYKVVVGLAGSDLYVVQRVFDRGFNRFVKKVYNDVYADQIGEVCYNASCYLDPNL